MPVDIPGFGELLTTARQAQPIWLGFP
jgi:hypothetical protein